MLLVACGTGPVNSERASPPDDSGDSPLLDDTATPLAPGSRYSVTFSAANETCRGYTFSHDGTARLITDARGHSVFELETTPVDPFEGMDIQLSPPRSPDERSRTTVCRWGGSTKPGPQGHVSDLVLETVDEDCGDSLTMQCRSQPMTLPDDKGVEASISVVSCRVREPMPTALWVLTAGGDIMLSADGLHSEVRQVTMGMSRQQLTRTAR